MPRHCRKRYHHTFRETHRWEYSSSSRIRLAAAFAVAKLPASLQFPISYVLAARHHLISPALRGRNSESSGIQIINISPISSASKYGI
jgi:hypothetical protein